MKTFYWSLVLMMLLPSMAYTQNTEKENEFSMSMQIRPRAEYRNGAWFPRNEGVKAASSINNRARLSIDYKRSDLEIKMSAQHVGVWGQDPQIDKNGRFVLNEAWAKLDLWCRCQDLFRFHARSTGQLLPSGRLFASQRFEVGNEFAERRFR
jgi:hypothetical protein